MAHKIRLDPKAETMIDLADHMLGLMRDVTLDNRVAQHMALHYIKSVPVALWKHDSMQQWLIAILQDFPISLCSGRSAQKQEILRISTLIFSKLAMVPASLKL